MEQKTDTADNQSGNGGNIKLLYVHEDVMGNTRYHAKDNGQSYAELEYDIWGNPTSPNMLLNNDNGVFIFATFTGHIYDTVLDIYFAEARFYDAKNRQWLNSDPMKDGLNWYQYVRSNPATFIDSSGLWGSDIHKTATEKWAIRSGFSEEDAETIAKADNGVDSGDTNPLKYKDEEATSWHFNTNQDKPDKADSRWIHYRDNLNLAVAMYKAGNKELALKTFGRGLHAKQDMYAHWTCKPVIGEINPHHAYFENVDCKRGSVERRGNEFFGASTKAFDNTKYDLRFGKELIRTSVIEENGRQNYTYAYAEVYVAYIGSTRIAETQAETEAAFEVFKFCAGYTVA